MSDAESEAGSDEETAAMLHSARCESAEEEDTSADGDGEDVPIAARGGRGRGTRAGGHESWARATVEVRL